MLQRSPVRTIGLVAVLLVTSAIVLAQTAARKPNVLFIVVDDLRPQLGSYGHALVQSPNMDRLAGQGLLFERAYCQQAICMSSRASVLSGHRPDKGGIYRNGPLFEHVPDALTLNQHFLNHGYETVSLGKVYHHPSDDDRGWSRKAFQPKGPWVGRGYLSDEAIRIVKEYPKLYPKETRTGMGPAFEAPDVPDSSYPDGVVAERAMTELNRLKDRPFFLALGFSKPHLPFNAPKKYWDLYDPRQIAVANNPNAPRNSPREAATDGMELRGYHGIPRQGPLPDGLARQLIHGYLACISYTDAQIGKVLDELDRLGLSDETLVVLWGDHGWKLGEHGMWAKHTNFELDTRVPLIIRAPNMPARGRRTTALAELVDLYPTLAQLCGLPLPGHLEGTSLVPLLENPDRPGKQAAFSQYFRGKVMGYSLRTDRYRYTEWRDLESGALKARELYDQLADEGENNNVVADPDKRELIASLAGRLKEGFPAARL